MTNSHVVMGARAKERFELAADAVGFRLRELLLPASWPVKPKLKYSAQPELLAHSAALQAASV